jgi:hypothetical protein
MDLASRWLVRVSSGRAGVVACFAGEPSPFNGISRLPVSERPYVRRAPREKGTDGHQHFGMQQMAVPTMRLGGHLNQTLGPWPAPRRSAPHCRPRFEVGGGVGGMQYRDLGWLRSRRRSS